MRTVSSLVYARGFEFYAGDAQQTAPYNKRTTGTSIRIAIALENSQLKGSQNAIVRLNLYAAAPTRYQTPPL